MHAAQARDVGEALVDRVFLDGRRVAADDSVHALRKEGIGLVVGWEYHRIGTFFERVRKFLATQDAARFCLVGAGRDDTALFAGDDGFAA